MKFLWAVGVVAAAKSVCILTDDTKQLEKSHTKMIDMLKAQFTVEVRDVSTAAIIDHEELVCDNLIMMAPDLKKWTAKINSEIIEEYVEKGGNVLLTVSPESRQPLRSLAQDFGFDLLPNGYYLSDTEDLSSVPKLKLKGQVITKAEATFSGIGHKPVASNPLVFSVLTGGTHSVDPKEQKAVAINNGAAVSMLQARNNARVGFAGSVDMFSDAAGNQAFVKDTLWWVFQERQVLRVAEVNHHKYGDQQQQTHYRIKDDFVYAVAIEEYKDGKWVPFKLPSGDSIQLEMVMIDPYIRVNLKPSNQTLGTYELRTILPDVYGVYTLKVDYKRHGWSYITEKHVVSIVPFRHDEYPRFLIAAYPYYLSVGISMSAFVAFVAFYLFHSDKEKVVVVKKQSSGRKPSVEKKTPVHKIELVKGPEDFKKIKKQQ